MRKRTIFSAGTAMVLSIAPTVGAVAPALARSEQAVTVLDRDATGVRFRVPRGSLAVTFWGDRIARVTMVPAGAVRTMPDLALVGQPARVAWTLQQGDGRYTLATPAMRLTIDATDGHVTLLNRDGKPLLAESDPDRRSAGRRPGVDTPVVRQGFAMPVEGAVYGLGQHQAGLLDYRGTTVRLQQANTDVGVPVLVSTAGFGLFWNNASITDVAVDTPQAGKQIVFRSQAGTGIDYFLFAGPDVDAILGAYRQLTGQAPLLPRWAWGLWQSKERYASQEELLGVAAEYRRLRIPLDAVVQDWQYWTPGGWGSHRMDPARFPDPAGMLAALHRQHLHSIVSVWPRFDLGLDNTRALDAIGGLYPKTYPNVYPAGEGRWYDAFSAPARTLYWQQIAQRLGTIGFDGYWLDGSEAELGGHWGEMAQVETAAGPGALVYNAYPLMHTTAVHDGMAADFPEKRPLLLTRSAWAGQQRNAAFTWSGDISGSWDVLRRQIPAGVNFSMSGNPFWSADIGGFFGGSPKDPAYQQLFTRWLQFAVFNPMFRIHGTGEGKELYSFPEGVRGPLLDAVALRYRLLPAIYAQSWQVTERGASFLYPAGMVFPDDRAAYDLRDEYLFGRSILVSPVTEPDGATRSVYLPAGTAWYDFWTGERHGGGQKLTVATPIGHIPLHVAAGTILPLGAPVQYADQSPTLPVELRVYRGADGHFTLYDDAGDGQGWRRGERTTIELRLDDKAGTLTIGDRQGRYPGMAATRRFRIVVVARGVGAGLEEGAGQDIVYTGKRIVVRL